MTSSSNQKNEIMKEVATPWPGAEEIKMELENGAGAIHADRSQQCHRTL